MRLTGNKKDSAIRLAALVVIGVMCIGFAVLLSRCASGATAAENLNVEENTPLPRLNSCLNNSMSDIDSLSGLDKMINAYLTRWEIKGAQFAYVRHDSLLYVKGFGYSDKEKGTKMETSNIMRMASVSKLVTAVGIMKLRDDGLISLSDKVFGANGILNDSIFTSAIRDKRYFDITVEHLLRHEGGFGVKGGDPMFSTRYIIARHHLTEPPDNATLLTILLKKRLDFIPGTSHSYSNLGYMILSLVIEKISGKPYEEFMRSEVLEPAGCYDFHIAGNYEKDRLPGETVYYMHGGSEPQPEFNNSGKLVNRCYGENDITNLKGAGAWVASASELSRLVASIDLYPEIPDILSSESIALMTEYDEKRFAIGWNFTPDNGPWIRTGSMAGTSAIILKYPDGDCLILLTNTSTWKGHGFSKDTRDFFARLRQKYSKKMPRRNLFCQPVKPQ